MKRKLAIVILIVSLVSFCAQWEVQALTIEFRSGSDSFNDSYTGWATKASGSFGQMPSSGEFGIFVNVRQRQNADDRSSQTKKKLFFTPADGKLEASDGKLYYVSPSGKQSLLAEKGFLGWRQKGNVSIYTRIIREPGRLRLKVEMDIE